MIVGVIAEESLLALAIPPVDIYVDQDVVPSPTLNIPGFLLFEGPFNADDTFYQAYVGDVDNSIFPPLFVDPDTTYDFGKAYVAALVAPFVTDGDVFFRPIVLNKILGPQLYIDTDIFGGVRKLTQGKATINQTFPIDTVLDIDIIYGALVERSGIVVITQQIALATDYEIVHVNETTSSVITLLGSFVGETASYTPPPLGYLSPHPIGIDDAFFAANVLGPLAPGVLVDVDVFYTPGRLNYVAPNAVLDSDVVFAPFAARQLLPGAVAAADVINGPFFTQPGSFALVVDAGESIPAPAVAGQRATVAPGPLSDSDTFYAPSSGQGIIAPYDPALIVDVVLAPSVQRAPLTPVVSVVDPELIFSPVVGAAPVISSVVVDTDAFFAPSMGITQTSNAGIITDTDTFFAPNITQAGFDGTLALDGPIMPATPQPTVIYIEG